MPVKPITPSQVDAQGGHFPDAVIESFNELIVAKWRNGSATVRSKEVVERMVEKGLDESEIWQNEWLDVEDVYRRAGWKVEYEQPSRGDADFGPYFTFSKKR